MFHLLFKVSKNHNNIFILLRKIIVENKLKLTDNDKKFGDGMEFIVISDSENTLLTTFIGKYEENDKK